ncbi:MAG: zeta toxin family protein [Odoribacteraceae bacterium]|jgi:probable phosphoglycerate mutase|nr:zeta toxin family protein [Odoribacteraceae bacterium]
MTTEELARALGGGQRLDELLPGKRLRERVLKEYDAFTGKKKRLATPSPAPRLLNISGIPGAGKSTLARRIREEEPSLLYLSFDELMESLTPYREDLLEHGAAEAFKRWEAPARHLGYRFLGECVERRHSLLFEHSNATPGHVALYRHLKSRGYRVEIRFIDAEPSVALARARQRERFLPAGIIAERHALLQALNERYKAIVDTFETIPT